MFLWGKQMYSLSLLSHNKCSFDVSSLDGEPPLVHRWALHGTQPGRCRQLPGAPVQCLWRNTLFLGSLLLRSSLLPSSRCWLYFIWYYQITNWPVEVSTIHVLLVFSKSISLLSRSVIYFSKFSLIKENVHFFLLEFLSSYRLVTTLDKFLFLS